MKIKVELAAKDLTELIRKVNEELLPIHITSEKGNAVLIADSEWSSIVETLYIFSSLENAKILIDSTLEYQNGKITGKTYEFEDLRKFRLLRQ